MLKTERFEMRLSHTDLATLDTRRGPLSRTAWLTHMIRNGAIVKPDTETGYVPDTDLADAILADEPDIPPHRHKRGEQIGETVRGGLRQTQYRCATTGCTHILES